MPLLPDTEQILVPIFYFFGLGISSFAQALIVHAATHAADLSAGTMVECTTCIKQFRHTPTISELARARAGVRLFFISIHLFYPGTQR